MMIQTWAVVAMLPGGEESTVIQTTDKVLLGDAVMGWIQRDDVEGVYVEARPQRVGFAHWLKFRVGLVDYRGVTV